ncbi:MAG: hypothetical protein VX899_14385 [Myxococcota bacterium]|nr:hypothetical protein [Myxococcota bacterium]
MQTLPSMYHHVARTRQGLLFETWEEAAALWARLTRALPGAEAICLMPNHVHVQHERDLRLPLARALSGHTRSLNHRRGLRGRVLEPVPAPRWAADAQKRRREGRYIHLNPCRAGMVQDPLCWPWSTYRDAVGLTLRPVRRRVGEPEALHRYTSADAHVDQQGTLLPVSQGVPTLLEIQAAVSEALRAPMVEQTQRGPSRTLFIQSALALAEVSPVQVADFVGVHRGSVSRTSSAPPEALRLVARLAGDPRFPGIPSGPGPWSRSVRWRVGASGPERNTALRKGL